MTTREILCGVPKPGTGAPCPFPARLCRVPGHREARRQRQRDESIAARDLRRLGWWLIDQTLGQTQGADLEPQRASVAVRVMGLLERLGPDATNDEDTLREVALRGMVMAGVPPRTPEEWALAERLFDDDALTEMRRWPPLFESDGGDTVEPLVLREDGRGEGEVAAGRLVDDSL